MAEINVYNPPRVCERCAMEEEPGSTVPWLILNLNVPAKRPLPKVLCPKCTDELVLFLLGRELSDIY